MMTNPLPGTTVTIDGRRFPICTVICPATDQDRAAGLTDADRSLPGGYDQVWIPAENGTLLVVEPATAPAFRGDGGLLSLAVYSPICTLTLDFNPDDPPIWLPQGLVVMNNQLISEKLASIRWKMLQGAEPWWVVEQIDRLSRMPVIDVVDGPKARLVT